MRAEHCSNMLSAHQVQNGAQAWEDLQRPHAHVALHRCALPRFAPWHCCRGRSTALCCRDNNALESPDREAGCALYKSRKVLPPPSGEPWRPHNPHSNGDLVLAHVDANLVDIRVAFLSNMNPISTFLAWCLRSIHKIWFCNLHFLCASVELISCCLYTSSVVL